MMIIDSRGYPDERSPEDQIESLLQEIGELEEHIEAIEDERNLYIDFLEHLGYSALDAHDWRNGR